MAFYEFEIELDSRRFEVSADIRVREGCVEAIELDRMREWIDDESPDVDVPISSLSEKLRTDLCADIERQISDPGTLHDIEAEDIETLRSYVTDSQISAWKEGY